MTKFWLLQVNPWYHQNYKSGDSKFLVVKIVINHNTNDISWHNMHHSSSMITIIISKIIRHGPRATVQTHPSCKTRLVLTEKPGHKWPFLIQNNHLYQYYSYYSYCHLNSNLSFFLLLWSWWWLWLWLIDYYCGWASDFFSSPVENAGLVNISHFYLQAFNTFQPSLTLW